MLVQPRICVTTTGPTGQKQRMFQEEDGFDFREAATQRLISAELRRFSPDSVTVHPPDVVCRSGISLKINIRCAASANPLVNHVCNPIHEQLKREKPGLPWCTLAGVGPLDPASVKKIQAMEKLGVPRSRQTIGKKQVIGRQRDQKTWH